MSPRLIAILMLTISATAMATETTTEAVVEEVQTDAEAVVEETQAAAEEATEEAEAAVEEVAEEAEAATEEVVEETQAAAEEATEEAEAVVEEVAEEAEATAEEVVEETQAAAEEATEEAEAAVEEVAEEAEATAEEATEEAEASSEEVVEEAQATTEEVTDDSTQDESEAATEVTTTESQDGEVVEVVDVDEPSEIEKEAASQEAAGTVDVQAKIAACAACHGADGNSVIPQNPKLAGQVPGFIADQLSKFKSGERDNAIMTAQVANLTDEDMIAIDAHYSAQQAQLGAIPEDQVEDALIGQKIFRGGEPSMSISACMSCHGPNGDGIPIRFPRVSGQHVEYLEQSLLAYKTGARKSDVMNSIAFRLSEQQIRSLALYMHGLK